MTDFSTGPGNRYLLDIAARHPEARTWVIETMDRRYELSRQYWAALEDSERLRAAIETAAKPVSS